MADNSGLPDPEAKAELEAEAKAAAEEERRRPRRGKRPPKVARRTGDASAALGEPAAKRNATSPIRTAAS
jgi:hypothetical protein